MESEILKILSEEHQNILKVIEFLEEECYSIENGKKLDKGLFEKIIDFIRNYADKFHHAKEEDILFKEMNKNQKELHCNPIEQMLYEHDLGRNYVRGMEGGVKENNKNKVIENARGYCRLLKEHIYKEDNILYPMASESLNENIQKSMLQKFNKIGIKKKKDTEKYIKFVKQSYNG